MAMAHRWLAAAAAAAAPAACSHQPVHTWPSELAAHAAELTTTGRARVEVVEPGDHLVRPDTRVTVAIPDGPGRRIRELTVGELVAGCGGDGPCLAHQVVQTELVVGTRRKTHVAGTVSSALSGAAIAGLTGYCLAECSTKQVVIGGGVIAALAVLTVLSFAWD